MQAGKGCDYTRNLLNFILLWRAVKRLIARVVPMVPSKPQWQLCLMAEFLKISSKKITVYGFYYPCSLLKYADHHYGSASYFDMSVFE